MLSYTFTSGTGDWPATRNADSGGVMKKKCSIFKGSRLALPSLLLMLGLTNPAAAFDFDIDQDGQAQPLTDGLLMIRHLFGFSGTALTNGAIAADAERREAAAIESYLTENRPYLDIDGDGKALPLTDGLLIIRHLFGFSGDALVQGAIAEDAKIKLPTDIEDQLIAVKSGSVGNNPAIDLDGDGISNVEDLDDDGDGVLDVNDAFPLIALDGRLDTDSDGRPDACDTVCTALGMTVDFDRDNDGLLDSLGLIGSSFNAHVIALSDHVDASAKPTFYGLNPVVEDRVLKIDLSDASIDLSPIQAVLASEASGADAARVVFLLDRVPAMGESGSLKLTIALIDGDDSVFGLAVNERRFKTDFQIDWVSNGTQVDFSAPIQDQVVETAGPFGPLWVEASRTLKSVQPSILIARVPSEYPGYPLLLEFDLLALFGEGLVESLKEAGLFDLITTYFDTVSNYFLIVELTSIEDSGTPFLGYQGQSFDRIEGAIKIQDVALGVSDGFDLSVQPSDVSGLQTEFTVSLDVASSGSEKVVQGLFSVLCDKALCFQQLPGGYLSSTSLMAQIDPGDSAQASILAGLSRLPASAENLTYRVTWTEGVDGVRSQDERMLTMSVPLVFEPDGSGGVFKPGPGGASLARTDNGDCAMAAVCEVTQLSILNSPITLASSAVDAARVMELELLPLRKPVVGTVNYFDDFFEAGPYHVQIELDGRSGLLSYAQETITKLEGILQVR